LILSIEKTNFTYLLEKQEILIEHKEAMLEEKKAEKYQKLKDELVNTKSISN